MPTYEYRCRRCGIVEISHSIVDEPRRRCPLCYARVERLISGGGGVVVDPGGFWETGSDGRERKVSRKTRETEWHRTAGRSNPLI